MSYSAPYLDEGGIHLPSYTDRLNDLIVGYKRIFGDDVYIAEDTMDYQLLSLVAKCWDDLNSLILDSYNARNPNFASASALDLLLPLNGIIRHEATSSYVELALTGAPGVVLEAGMQAMDGDNHIWEIGSPVVFDSQGKATAVAICTETGPIPAAIGAITVINTPRLGWLDVTNESEAVLGKDVESDAAVRKRRSQSVSLPSRSIMSGIRAALLNVTGVESVNVVENNTDTADGNGIPAHTIAAVVDGGADADVAEALWLKKSPGCGLAGDVIVNYLDEYNQTNEINFYRPIQKDVKVRIRLHAFASFEPSLLSEAIPQAVATFVNALGVGDDLIVGLLNAVIYNANTAGYPIFSVIDLEARTLGSNQQISSETPDNTLDAGFQVRFHCEGVANVTGPTDGAYTIEVT